MTTPTESTSNLGHQTSFTHHVNLNHIEHAIANNGEYEIDRPEDQANAKGKEYRVAQAIKLPSTMKLAKGGSVYCRHSGYDDDNFHAFPEQNIIAQRHLAMRRGDDEAHPDEIQNKAEGGPIKPVYTHEVYDIKTGEVKGQYQTANAARRGVDRYDNQYGGYRHHYRPIGEPQKKAHGGRTVAQMRLELMKHKSRRPLHSDDLIFEEHKL